MFSFSASTFLYVFVLYNLCRSPKACFDLGRPKIVCCPVPQPANGPESHPKPHQSISTVQVKSPQSNPTLHVDNPNYTKPLYNFKPNQIKLFDSPWIQPIRIHFSIQGFRAWLPCSIFWTYWLLVSFSELIVFRALSSARWDMDQCSFSLASLDETEKTWESTSMKLFILAEDGNTWLSGCFSLASSNIALRTGDLTPCRRGNTWSS